MGDLVDAKRPQRLPVVLTRDECRALLAGLTGTYRLVAALLMALGFACSNACS